MREVGAYNILNLAANQRGQQRNKGRIARLWFLSTGNIAIVERPGIGGYKYERDAEMVYRLA